MMDNDDLEAILAVLMEVLDERFGPIEARLNQLEATRATTTETTTSSVEDRWAEPTALENAK